MKKTSGITSAVVRRDWSRNRVSAKSLFIVTLYRASAWVAQHQSRIVRFAGMPVRVTYKVLVEFMLGVELPDRVQAGPGLAVFHGVGLVVHSSAVLGADVTLRQNTTIGAKEMGGRAPVIGDSVSIGVNAVIIGDIVIGTGSVIGAGAVVVESCPPGTVAYAAKALMKYRKMQ
jgi:serine acetyltransferase